ncbi:MAG: agmatinase [Acidobacteriota bacterium]
MRAPLIRDPAHLDVALIGVPYDGATEARPGARYGPRDIRNMSTFMRAVHHVTRVNPYQMCRIADMGDVPLNFALDVEASHREIQEFFQKVHSAGAIPLSAGGDHSISLAILRALAPGEPLGLIQIDAHTDTWNEELGSRYSHGTPFRRAVEEGLLDPVRTVQIGVRGAANSDEAWAFSARSGMRVIFMEEFTSLGVEAVVAEARRVVGQAPTYLTFDVDGLDPAFTPGTGTPEIGGLTTVEALALIRGLRGLHLIGADVVEVSPPFDPSGNTALVAATMMYEILCLLAERVASTKSAVNTESPHAAT